MALGTILLITLLAVLAVVVILAIVLVLRATSFSIKQPQVEPVALLPIDGENIAERLGLAVQYKTVSHQEREKFDALSFEGLHRLFERLYPKTHDVCKREIINDFSLLYTWEGTNPSLQPVLLMSHLDVVPADESEDSGWQHPPFSGKLADGYVWGRGTLDIKSGVIGALEAVEYLLHLGFKPERTVYLAFGHDEEIGGEYGSKAIAALLESRGVRLSCLLDEGGMITEGFLDGIDPAVALVGISEKGYLSLKLKVQMDGGHSSMPAQETAIGLISRAVARLELIPFEAHLEVVQFMMSYLGAAMPFMQRVAFANPWLFGNMLKKRLEASNTTNAVIRTTTAPTIIHAGVKDNVLPPEAEAVVNFRLLPGDTLRSVYEEVLARIGDERVEVTPYQGETLDEFNWDPSPVADVESAQFYRLSRMIRESYEDTLVAPFLVVGATDARHYAAICRNAFRFTPIKLDKEELKAVHGKNERLSFDNCAKMVAFYIAFVKEMSTIPAALDQTPEVEQAEHDEDEAMPVPPVEETPQDTQ